MSYEVTAIGWVPNISRKVTSDEHLSACLNGAPARAGYLFEFTDGLVEAKPVNGDHPGFRIEPADDSGLCRIYVSEQPGSSETIREGGLHSLLLEMHLQEAWAGFRSLIDSSSDPRFLPASDSSYTTVVARYAICSAMSSPIPASEVESMGGWAQAVAARFVSNHELLTDDLKTYPRAHGRWSNPDLFWNRRKVINRALSRFMLASTNAVYFRSFIDIYSDRIPDVDSIVRQLDLRSKKLENTSQFIEEYMDSTNLGWLLASVIIALGLGCTSIAAGILA